MNHALNAADLFLDLKMMPTTERKKFFTLIATNAFRDENFTHEQRCAAVKGES